MSSTVISNTKSKTKSKSKCSYCDIVGHSISSCPEDNDMDKLLDSNVEPNFNNLSLKTLKKIASLTGLRANTSKPKLIKTFNRMWTVRNDDRDNKLSTLKKELTQKTTNNLDEQTECPICMDELGVTDNCTTKCGHKFCSSCFVKSVMRKNNCPMCRAHLIDDDEYYWPIERYLGESYNENIATRNHSATHLTPIDLYGELSAIDNNISVTDIGMISIDPSNNELIDLTVDMNDIFGPDSDVGIDVGSDDDDIPSLIDELFSQEEHTSNTNSYTINTGMSNPDFIESEDIGTNTTIITTSRNEHTIGVSTHTSINI